MLSLLVGGIRPRQLICTTNRSPSQRALYRAAMVLQSLHLCDHTHFLHTGTGAMLMQWPMSNPQTIWHWASKGKGRIDHITDILTGHQYILACNVRAKTTPSRGSYMESLKITSSWQEILSQNLYQVACPPLRLAYKGLSFYLKYYCRFLNFIFILPTTGTVVFPFGLTINRR